MPAALTELLTRRWFALWGLLLAMLAIGGRGFAYVGLPPLFVSEITLALGAAVFLLQPRWRQALRQPTAVLILALMALGIVHTVPYLGEHGLDAARDYMLFGYAATALFVACVVMSRPQLLGLALRRYQGFAKVFLVVMPLLWLLFQAAGDAMPTWPWADHVGLVELKPGDAAVHVGAVAALCILGLFRGRSLFWMGLLCLLVGITGAVTRAGLVSFALAFGVAFAFRPRSQWAVRLVVVMAVIVTLAAVTDVSFKVEGREREFSARQLLLNVTSTFVSSGGAGDLDQTKTWRLEWWEKIWGYTVEGPHFWTGKGFGVNLATDDDFQVFEDESLRSPHNATFTVLARTGVPGLVLWGAVNAAFLYVVANGYLSARHRGEPAWAMFFVFLLSYYAALTFNASFDVFFEGPMGGVWFWSVVGLGYAGAWVFERHPEVLHDPALEPREG
ncbi:MAG: O-antigen ligase family protein [Planctomycetota bacterium]